MIRFIFGFFSIIAAVGAIEGTAGISIGILLSTIGIITMLWGLSSINERN
jgi:hypothetical protein